MRFQNLQPNQINNPEVNRVYYHPLEDYEDIPPNTLDDSVGESMLREFKQICFKFSHAIFPRSVKGQYRLKNWDLWGPFVMALTFGLFVNNENQFVLIFAAVFVGATVLTFNTRILGGKITYFQSVSILGYCIFPLFIMLLLFKLLVVVNFNNFTVRVIGIIIATIWCCYSAQAFIASNIEPQKKLVALFPICIFYFFIGLMIIYM